MTFVRSLTPKRHLRWLKMNFLENSLQQVIQKLQREVSGREETMTLTFASSLSTITVCSNV